MNVAVILGTRPEIIKLSEVIKKLDEHVQLFIIHTGQNYDYELNQIFFKQLGIREPDVYLDAAGENPSETVANVIARSYDHLKFFEPDAVLIYGDTNSCLAAYSAKRLRIPIFHMEAGNRCFDQRVPEEINRKIIDHLSDINLTVSEHARRYLIEEGISPETVIKIGSSMREVITKSRGRAKYLDLSLGYEPKGYILVSCHREENVDYKFNEFVDCLNFMADKFQKRIIVSMHPRTKKLFQGTDKELNSRIELHKPFGFNEYIQLQCDAYCVVSDSGTITEEASILNFPAVTIRQTHERPEGMDCGVLTMCDLIPEDLNLAIDVEVSSSSTRVVPDYADTDVSEKVLKIILSYTDYINRTVWRKQ